jgi:hypothetical protein
MRALLQDAAAVVEPLAEERPGAPGGAPADRAQIIATIQSACDLCVGLLGAFKQP